MVVVIRFQDRASFETGSRSVFGMGSRMGPKSGQILSSWSGFETGFLVGEVVEVGVGLWLGLGVKFGAGFKIGFLDASWVGF
ncbi:hypothetical protein TIFTF001_033965 [Ficus carica]|uniref:Uncharacterized protein n=1 Tax=Ficus carica TaxID=3494 RepID=A0AA88DZK8_FICCA|nr:hypothetical protein TIFTF001_033965 [Ficus carica]